MSQGVECYSCLPKTAWPPTYLISQNDRKVVMRNFEGVIATYSEPTHYEHHQTDNCEYCRRAAPKEGVAKLLAGDAVVLEPEGLRRKQRRTKRLDAECKTRRKTQIQLPIKMVEQGELLLSVGEFSTPSRPPAKQRTIGRSRAEG